MIEEFDNLLFTSDKSELDFSAGCMLNLRFPWDIFFEGLYGRAASGNHQTCQGNRGT